MDGGPWTRRTFIVLQVLLAALALVGLLVLAESTTEVIFGLCLLIAAVVFLFYYRPKA